MRCLALDISTACGFAVDRAADDPLAGSPRVGTWRLPGLDDAQRVKSAARLSELVESAVDTWQVDFLAVEAPVPAGQIPGSNVATLQMLFALAIQACAEAERAGIGYGFHHVMAVRKHFLGQGRPENPKRLVMARCAQLGWMVADHNQADAAALWCFAKSLRDPSWSPNGTTLFRQREARA